MRIVALTDIHGKLKYMDKAAHALEEADVVLLPGDLTMFGGRPEVEEVLSAVKRHGKRILGVMGNCDYPEVEAYLKEEDMCLHRNHVLVDGVAFVGLGGSLPCPLPTLNEWPEDVLADYLDEAVKDIPDGAEMVLVSHQPAKDTAVDLAGNGAHVGSESVRKFIEKHQPLVCFSGHIHESVGVDTIGNTKLVNPGPFMDGGYAVADIGPGVQSLDICSVAQ